MIFNVTLRLELDNRSNHIPTDDCMDFMEDLLKDLFYDADDVTILEMDISKEK